MQNSKRNYGLQNVAKNNNLVERSLTEQNTVHLPFSTVQEKFLSDAAGGRRIPKPRHSRAKRHVTWVEVDLENGGIYTSYLQYLAKRFPALSGRELMVAALVKGMYTNRDISNVLMIDIKTVENHRIRIRRKLGLDKENLACYLAGN